MYIIKARCKSVSAGGGQWTVGSYIESLFAEVQAQGVGRVELHLHLPCA